MGAGKSTVGRDLARRLDVTFVDNDEQLSRHTGRTAAEVTTTEGTDRSPAEIVDEIARRVVSSGGG